MLMVICWINSLEATRFLCFEIVYNEQSIFSYLKTNFIWVWKEETEHMIEIITANNGIFLFWVPMLVYQYENPCGYVTDLLNTWILDMGQTGKLWKMCLHSFCMLLCFYYTKSFKLIGEGGLGFRPKFRKFSTSVRCPPTLSPIEKLNILICLQILCMLLVSIPGYESI